MNRVLGVVLRILGIGALVAGGVAVALVALAATILLGPLVFWIAWNVLDFGPAVGLPELGFWGIVLATLFLVVGWRGKVLITGIVFLADPSWFEGSARVKWPEWLIEETLKLRRHGELDYIGSLDAVTATWRQAPALYAAPKTHEGWRDLLTGVLERSLTDFPASGLPNFSRVRRVSSAIGKGARLESPTRSDAARLRSLVSLPDFSKARVAA